MTKLKIEDNSYLEKMRRLQTFPQHLHWDGSIPAEDVVRIAKERGKQLVLGGEQVITPDQLRECWKNLFDHDMEEVFDLTKCIMQNRDELMEASSVLCRYLKSQNIPYAEVRFAPRYHTKEGMSMERCIDHAVAGFRKAKDETGVDARLIICINREADPHTGVQIAEAAVVGNRRYPDMVLGIDLACYEVDSPPDKHQNAFERTFDTPLKRTVHAGEMCDEETNIVYIRNALVYLRPDAISHAIPLWKDEDLYRGCPGESIIDYMVKNNIRLESNPVCNNFFFNYDIEDLHLDELVDKGVLVTINPDDPAMIPDGDMAHNLYHLGRLYGDSFIEKVIRNSIETSWGLTREEKDRHLESLRAGTQ